MTATTSASDASAAPAARLITIPFSHYVEKARWALSYAGVPFREEGHVPLLHWRATLAAGARRTVPALCVAGRVLADSTDIVQYADARAPAARKLYPEEPAARRECEALEEFFDTRYGADTRRLVYFHLLPDTRMTHALLARGVPAWERAALPWFLPVMRAMMRRGLRIDAAGVARSKQRIDAAFARVAELLADGRPYLLGDRFTAADLTFAALSAPLVTPPEYGVPLPTIDEVPAEAAALMRAYRASAPGEFALRLYREQRAPAAAAAAASS